MCQFAICGHQQQATGIDIESADGNPACAMYVRQAVKHGFSTLWVGSGGDLTCRFIVNQVALSAAGDYDLPVFAIDVNPVTGANQLTETRG